MQLHSRMPASSSTPPWFGNGDGVDLLSSLPEGLLLDILGRLGCAREAARTSVLSRRWRGFWADLRELTFDGLTPDTVKIALVRLRPNLNLLRIGFQFPHDRSRSAPTLTAARISSLLRAADRLAPSELDVSLGNYLNHGFLEFTGAESAKFELPCFERATSFVLFLSTLEFTLPAAGEFASLGQLTMTVDTVDLGELIPRCPRLRMLKVDFRRPARNGVTVQSRSLQELELSFMHSMERTGVVIEAPELNRFILVSVWSGVPNISLLAPKLAELRLQYIYERSIVGSGERWRLSVLSFRMGTEWSDMHRMYRPSRDHVLSLNIYPNHSRYSKTAERGFAQEVALLPVNAFSVLELSVRTQGHVFGPLVLELLRVGTSIQSLKLFLMAGKYVGCSENCDCDEDRGWRNERVCLPDLGDVDIQGFSATDHEVDFLELLLGSSPMLKRINIKLSADEVSPSDEGCQKLHNIVKANVSVKCSVYGKSGDEISFA